MFASPRDYESAKKGSAMSLERLPGVCHCGFWRVSPVDTTEPEWRNTPQTRSSNCITSIMANDDAKKLGDAKRIEGIHILLNEAISRAQRIENSLMGLNEESGNSNLKFFLGDIRELNGSLKAAFANVEGIISPTKEQEAKDEEALKQSKEQRTIFARIDTGASETQEQQVPLERRPDQAMKAVVTLKPSGDQHMLIKHQESTLKLQVMVGLMADYCAAFRGTGFPMELRKGTKALLELMLYQHDKKPSIFCMLPAKLLRQCLFLVGVGTFCLQLGLLGIITFSKTPLGLSLFIGGMVLSYEAFYVAWRILRKCLLEL